MVDGQNISTVTQDSLRENIAVIPQDTMLFHRTLFENIKYGRFNATDDEVIEASKAAHIHEFITNLPDGYQTYVGERGVKLSGGQRQRICIARALGLSPKFIICDESVSALDVSVQAQVLNLLNELKEEFKFTYIFISHDLSVVKFMSDRMVVMQKGKVEEMGDPDEIYINPKSEYTKKLIDSIPKGNIENIKAAIAQKESSAPFGDWISTLSGK